MNTYWNKFSNSAKAFVDSVDPNVQKQIEADIKEGKLSEQKLNILEEKQEEIRNKIEFSGMEMTVNNMKQLLNSQPDISNDIKDVFTYYYTEIMDRIPNEQKHNMTDTTDDIQQLDSTILLMYCIELICNPENYVLNYETHTKFTPDELEEAMKKCEQEGQDDRASGLSISGTRDHAQGITSHPSRRVDPSGTKKGLFHSSLGGRKKNKSKNTKGKKTRAKKTRAKKTRAKKAKSKNVKSKKVKSKKVKRNTKRR
jgi:hypothetical protein